MKRWKFLKTGYKSDSGNHKWTIGKWYEHKDDLKLCESGFHCSKGIYQAFSYVQGEILALVEVKGKHIDQNDKEVWEKMRVIKSYGWTEKDSVLFSVFAAYLVIDNFEEIFPDDKRPREAIEAAENYVKNPTEKNRSAAASAAWSAARSARSAAASAAWSAESAARSAARSAASAWSAWSAASAAWSARSAAASAAWSAGSALYKKLDTWMLSHVKELKVLKEAK